jgi:tetratricopeptide (TPR) repeat protein
LEITRKLVKQTLRAFNTVNKIPEVWHDSYMLKAEHHDKAYKLEEIVKKIIRGNLSQCRKSETVPDDYNIKVNYSLSKDFYVNHADLYTAIERDIGDRGVDAELKQWSTIYHIYFVEHTLKLQEIADIAGYTAKHIRNYLNSGIDRLVRCLQSTETNNFREAQATSKLAPQTIYERHAQNLVDEAQNLLDQSSFDLALIKSDEAIAYATTHKIPLALVHAHTVKAYTLLQGQAESVETVVSLLNGLEFRLQNSNFCDDVAKAYIMTTVKIQRAFLSKRLGYLEDAIHIATEATQWAASLSKVKPKLLSEALYVQGTMLWANGKYHHAMKACHESVQILDTFDIQTIDVYSAHSMIGLIYWSLCQYWEAERYIKKSIERVKAYQHYWLMAYEQGNLGLVYLSQHRIKESERAILQQATIAESYHLNMELIRAYANLGIIKLHDGQLLEAQQLLEKSKSDYESLHKLEGLCVVAANLSQLYTNLGKHDQALEVAQYAIHIAEKKLESSPPAHIIALRCFSGCEDLEQNIRYEALLKALDLSKNAERRFDEAACLLGLAFLTSDIEQKRELWQQGEKLLRSIDAAYWLRKLTSTRYPHLLIIM